METETKNLTLPLKEKWYRMIESGEKKEEYRNIVEYWELRLMYRLRVDAVFPVLNFVDLVKSVENGDLAYRDIDTVTFTLGYPRKNDASRRMTFKCDGIHIGTGKPEWGAIPYEFYYVIKIGERIK